MKTSLVLLALSVAACGKPDKSEPASSAAGAIDVASINALVPAELKDKLVFEQRVVEQERYKVKTSYTLAGPTRWKTSDEKMFASLSAPTDDGFNATEISLGTYSLCDGPCGAKASEDAYFKHFRTEPWKITKDESGKTSHLMVAEFTTSDSVHIMYAWWQDGATSYNTCSVTLDAPDIRKAAPAFEKACQAVNVKRVD
ncbi:MAG: hypothetical protein M3619_24065 [Myxococcota bacterium]|nr:hypothetical protein [Myxococcota bacterium]